MKKSLLKFILLFFILNFYFFIFSSHPAFAVSCETLHVNFSGQCVASEDNCPIDKQGIDTSRTDLCPSGQKCCYKTVGGSGTDFKPVSTENLELQIPLFEYSSAKSLVEYIAKLYEYILIILVPLAIIMIIWGGLQWILAAGEGSKISAAKNQIIQAFVGLFIGLSSYIILSLIGITSLNLAGIQVIGPDEGMPIILENVGTASATIESVGGQCFPVKADSFQKISWNWGARRSSGSRCHAGIDIYTKGPGTVLAIADGTVTALGHFYNCSGGPVDKVMINHGTFTVNYGEINTGKIASGIKVGSQVTAGQVLGVATNCGMLHFELYEGKASSSRQWYPPSGQSVGSGNYCREHYLATKPATLLDPTKTIESLKSKLCGG